jgi:hypothetical protein
MPFRLDEKYGEFRAKMQFTTASWMPYKVYQACLRTGILSNTRYCQEAICEKLARDLDLDLNELLSQLPRGRTVNTRLWDPTGKDTNLLGPTVCERHAATTRVAINRYGMGNHDEEVR